MKKLSAKQIAELKEHVECLQGAGVELVAAIENANAAIRAKHEALVAEVNDQEARINLYVEEYNDAVRDAEEWRSGIVDAMTEYQGQRSEKWAGSEAGEAYQAWIDSWETELEEVELDSVDEGECPKIEEPDLSATGAIDDMQEEP